MPLQGAPELSPFCHQAPPADTDLWPQNESVLGGEPALAQWQGPTAAAGLPAAAAGWSAGRPQQPQLQLRPASELVQPAAGADNQQTAADESRERHVLHGGLRRVPARTLDTVKLKGKEKRKKKKHYTNTHTFAHIQLKYTTKKLTNKTAKKKKIRASKATATSNDGV
uniref:(northern house mosquito) hypothetical protein n=1 Tax=Culex pipiens TaxID=7175 RepID=A0A8D8CFM2_CULPI